MHRSFSEKASSSRRAALMGLLLALAAVLNIAEGMLPAVPALPPGVRLGLANTVVLYCVLFLGWKEAVTLSLLKSLFVLVTRGASAGFISLTGGVFAVLIMLFLSRFRTSILIKSVSGAVFHNVGQLCAAALYMKTASVFYYAPILFFFAVLTGSLTAVVTKAAAPAMRRIFPGKQQFPR